MLNLDKQIRAIKCCITLSKGVNSFYHYGQRTLLELWRHFSSLTSLMQSGNAPACNPLNVRIQSCLHDHLGPRCTGHMGWDGSQTFPSLRLSAICHWPLSLDAVEERLIALYSLLSYRHSCKAECWPLIHYQHSFPAPQK